jgi:hypothetical protein
MSLRDDLEEFVRRVIGRDFEVGDLREFVEMHQDDLKIIYIIEKYFGLLVENILPDLDIN